MGTQDRRLANSPFEFRAHSEVMHHEAFFIRRPMHDGQMPRPLHANATKCCSAHDSHFRRAKPRQLHADITRALRASGLLRA